MVEEFAIDRMLKAAVFPHPVTELRLRETTTSWVILTGEVAYKIKKPVRLEFLDSTSLDRRHFLCREELRLNREFAPEIYLDVAAITSDGAALRVDGPGPAIEYAVRMRQFEPQAELSSLLDRGAVQLPEMVAFGGSMARLHASVAIECDPAVFNFVERLGQAVLGNLATLLAHGGGARDLGSLGALIDWTHDGLRAHAAELGDRQRSGFVRECHGDLHAGNVVRWNGRLTPFDCLEFDPTLRRTDVMNDVAFLVMDVVARGREDLACGFLSAYVEQGGDYAGLPLLPFYAAYRALVRAMVDALVLEQQPPDAPRWRDRMHRKIAAAAGFMTRSAGLLVLMHGPSGSGKSWLSEQMIPRLAAIRVRSDVERKRLAGGGVPALYSPAMTRRVYERLGDCARSVLRGGFNAIVDAAFLRREERAPLLHLAAELGVRIVIVSCKADAATMSARIEARRLAAQDASDATVAVLREQVATMDALEPGERACAIEIDTSGPEPAAELARRLQSPDIVSSATG